MWRTGLTLFAFFGAIWGQAACVPTVTGRLETVHFESKVFHSTRTLRVWLPPGFDAAKRYPVLYILDGASAFDACTAYNHDELRADETLTELIGAGKVPALIAVGIDNGSDVLKKADDGAARAREFLPYEDPTFAGSRDPIGGAYSDFLEMEVLAAVARKYPVATGSDSTTLWGASYGAIAAVNILVRRPEMFGRMILESPALQVGNGQMLRDTMHLVMAPARIAVGIGTKEIPVELVKQLADNLKSTSTRPQVEINITEGGTHDTKTFGTRLAAALEFVYGTTKQSPTGKLNGK